MWQAAWINVGLSVPYPFMHAFVFLFSYSSALIQLQFNLWFWNFIGKPQNLDQEENAFICA